jgi:endoglucanase
MQHPFGLLLRGACASLVTLASVGALAGACASDPPPGKYATGGASAAGSSATNAAGNTAPSTTGAAGSGTTGRGTAGTTSISAAGGSSANPPTAGTAAAANGGAGSTGTSGETSPDAPKAAPGYLVTHGAKLYDSQGREVRITGVSWFGMEGGNFAPFGLSNQSLEQLLDRIVSFGFNTVRLPFCNQLFDSGSHPNVDQSRNPMLANKSGLQLMDAIVGAAKTRGLKVILDRHRPDANAQSDLWYTTQYSEQRWIDDWKMLATHFKDEPTVIAVDLHNEPKGAATWGDGNMMTDWKAAAERAGNAILAINPNLLIIVEGIEKIGNDYYWWGGQLAGAADKPVKLDVENRLVYSAHDYPASLYPQTWFMAADYPANLTKVWTDHWGYLVEKDIAPVFVGEFGTKLETDSDKQWLHALATYIGQHGMSFAFWSLNPNSGDTGGLLKDDWVTPQDAKLAELKPIQAARIE